MPAIGHTFSPDCETLEKLRLLCVTEPPLKSERKKTVVSRFQDSVKNKTRLNSIKIKKQTNVGLKQLKQWKLCLAKNIRDGTRLQSWRTTYCCTAYGWTATTCDPVEGNSCVPDRWPGTRSSCCLEASVCTSFRMHCVFDLHACFEKLQLLNFSWWNGNWKPGTVLHKHTSM